MPLLHLLAGPNGAGKSTYVRDVLVPATSLPFVNADLIAAQRSPQSQAVHAYEAAQIAGAERRAHIAAGDSFISETVFSHPSKVQLCRRRCSIQRIPKTTPHRFTLRYAE